MSFSCARRIEAQKRKERNEAHLYMTVNVVLEDLFESHHGHDLFDVDKSQECLRSFRIKKTDTLSQFIDMLAETLVRYRDGSAAGVSHHRSSLCSA